jgi:hypothetical protein
MNLVQFERVLQRPITQIDESAGYDERRGLAKPDQMLRTLVRDRVN